jgi:hypothetical protein
MLSGERAFSAKGLRGVIALRFYQLALVCTFLPTAVFAESYLCISDLVTGFSFDEQHKKWEIGRFKAEDKYIVTRSTGELSKWEVKETGQSIPNAFCAEDFTVHGGLRCNGLVEFRMNKNNLRFVLTYLIGFWSDNIPGAPDLYFKEGENTPFLARGRCSSF